MGEEMATEGKAKGRSSPARDDKAQVPKRTLRIAMLSWESLYSIKVGGIAPHVSELSEALAERGHEVHIFTRRGDFDAYDRINGVHYQSARWAEKCEQINIDANCAALAMILLDHIKQHLVSEKIISAQEIAAFASALESIQSVTEMARRYGIKPEESCDAKKAIADAFNKIEAMRRCCG